MQLDDMRIFVTAVDAGNFTAAANRLRLSKQFVSRRVGFIRPLFGLKAVRKIESGDEAATASRTSCAPGRA